jgi:hypothetical protein
MDIIIDSKIILLENDYLGYLYKSTNTNDNLTPINNLSHNFTE